MGHIYYRKLLSDKGIELWQCPPQGKYLVINRLGLHFPFYSKFFDKKQEAFEYFYELVKKY